jgi:hypothetical protein
VQISAERLGPIWTFPVFDHLPAAKQRELERVVQILFEEFGEATALATQDWKKKGRILKVILVWPLRARLLGRRAAHRQGLSVRFRPTHHRQRHASLGSRPVLGEAEERLIRELAGTRTLKTPVKFFVHTLQEVNDGLAHGRYFLMDVAQEGIDLSRPTTANCISQNPRRQSKRRRWRGNISRSGCERSAQARVGDRRPRREAITRTRRSIPSGHRKPLPPGASGHNLLHFACA